MLCASTCERDIIENHSVFAVDLEIIEKHRVVEHLALKSEKSVILLHLSA